MSTKTQTTQVKTFEFEQSNFPSLLLYEFEHTWNNITLDALSPDEQEGLSRLIGASGIESSPVYRPEVLLIKAERGIVKGVYGPGLFRYGDYIVLKVGENVARVEQEGDRLLVGKLKGKITVIEKEDAKKQKYPTAFCTFVAPDKSVFKVRVSLDSQQQGKGAGELEATLVNEESILPYLGQVPSPAIPMHELGEGEFEIIGFSKYQSENGTRHKIHLADGKVVWARGNSEMLLDSDYTKPEGKPLTLVVSHIEEFAPDKFKVDNAIRERLPRLTGVTESLAIETQAQTILDEDEIDKTEFEVNDEDAPF
ncbi:hypothetical protein C7H19_24130 [Aphanothece hegewaldii CCALA 016]|uniref:Uncharacterized protein n=1 Tax=Aphanothece hegewaldii CCALA 016 TaxID=2107694 RepID=A0A2T1LQT7_9CHRO|nr:hypothetical protein [Aphanothece hegewaldii]PSF30018.1 hypothetical protein C7H19_24130 [Aphanothece hegewaldii CCALA 016]